METTLLITAAVIAVIAAIGGAMEGIRAAADARHERLLWLDLMDRVRRGEYDTADGAE